MIIEITRGHLRMFKHMNDAALKRCQRQDTMPDLHIHKDMFELTHGVRVIVENSRWHALEFSSEQAYLMAVLKWS